MVKNFSLLPFQTITLKDKSNLVKAGYNNQVGEVKLTVGNSNPEV